jgi:hypothetical protein
MSRFARSAARQLKNRPSATEEGTKTYPWRRRVAQLVFTVSAMGALTAGAGTSAYAADATAPPSSSVAAPTESPVPQTGDADYWATDLCHYFAWGGSWWSDMCLRATLDAEGRALPNTYSDFQNLGDGQYGRELFRMDFNDPNRVAFAVVNDYVGQWYVVDKATSSQILGYTQDGTPTWVTPLPQEYRTYGGIPADAYPNWLPQSTTQYMDTMQCVNDGHIGIVYRSSCY